MLALIIAALIITAGLYILWKSRRAGELDWRRELAAAAAFIAGMLIVASNWLLGFFQ